MMDDVKFPAARNHPVLHAAPTFRPIARGRRRKGLERVHETPNGTLRTRMFYELDVADQDLLLCVLAIARSELYREVVEQDDIILEALELDLQHGKPDSNSAFGLFDLPALKISVTRYELLKELQRSTSGAKNYKWLEASLDRLSSVNFKYKGSQWSGSFNLLSYRFNEVTEQYDIFINPISAHSVALPNANYIFVHRQERHLLELDAARALHSYLSGVVRHGETRHLAIETVINAVFANYDEVMNPSTLRNRQKQIVDSCKELSSKLDKWDLKAVGRGKSTKIKVSRAR
jgi:hypothetical protein